MQVSFRLSPAGQAFRRHPPTIPLIVIGALKAGGSGKTSVTLALAQTFSNRGLKVAILAYRIGKGKANGSNEGDDDRILQEVKPGEDWRRSSDEAVLLQQESGCRVFVTRHRALAWMRLHSPRIYQDRPFDLILSDDGFQDPRLKGAMRILLQAPGERPGIFDLLPGGRYRQTWGGGKDADLVLVGPYAARPEGLAASTASLSFWRTLSIPKDLEKDKPCIAISAIGDNEAFLQDLNRYGIFPVQVLTGLNHSRIAYHSMTLALQNFPNAKFLCTKKDFLKFEPKIAQKYSLYLVDQKIVLENRIIVALEAYCNGNSG